MTFTICVITVLQENEVMGKRSLNMTLIIDKMSLFRFVNFVKPSNYFAYGPSPTLKHGPLMQSSS